MSKDFSRHAFSCFVALLVGVLFLGFATPANADPANGMNWYFGKSSIAGYSITKSTTGNGGRLHLVSWMGYDAYYGNFAKPRVSLQRKINGGSWHTVAQASYSKYAATAYTPAYATKANSAKVYYRFVSTAYTIDEDTRVLRNAYSKPMTVTYENQRRYTGLKREYYGYVQRYCPNTAIHLNGASSAEAGHYGSGQLLIAVSDSVGRMPANYRRAVLLHECGHERQFLNYGGTATGWSKMTKAMAQHFVNDTAPSGRTQEAGTGTGYAFNPVEHAADCASYSINPQGYLGYGGYCNSQEIAAGKRLMSGKRL